jgi:integration host factor subunit beta
MIRSELVDRIAAENPGMTHADAEKVVHTFFDTIAEHLSEGIRVELRGFGVFSARHRDARTGRNPRDGQTVQVAAKDVPFFKIGKDLHKRLNAE